MNNLKIICISVFLLGFLAGSAVAQISYCKDILEPGNPPEVGICDIIGGDCQTDLDCAGGGLACLKNPLKTWDETWEMNEGETIDMDIWINDVPEPMLTAGCFITYDTTLINITSFVPNDTNSGGQWDGESTSFFEVEPGVWFLALADFSCIEPDGDGDIRLARATFQCQAGGEVGVTVETIPAFDTLVGCVANNYDSQVSPNTVTITQIGEQCTSDIECDNGIFCDGAETCDTGTNLCQPGTPIDCDDGVGCTDDSCNEDTDSCDNVPNDANCDDGLYCNGEETCDSVLDCQAGTPVDCDDGLYCTTDECDENTNSCIDTGDPCDEGQICNEDMDSCDIAPCSITLDPPTAEVNVLSAVQFGVVIDGICANEPSYTWEISAGGCTGNTTGSAIGGTIDATGLYTAGNMEGTDIVRVIDGNNGDICADAEVTVGTPGTTTTVPTTTTTVPTTTTTAPTTTTTVPTTTTTVPTTIIIDGCDTGVMDMEIEDGNTMSDLIEECSNNADGKHGEFVSCVSKLTNEWKKDDLISGREKGAIQSCAAQANIP